MSDKDKTKEELITELQKLRQENKSLKVIYNRNITEQKQSEMILKDIIDRNPMSIQIVDKEGFTLQVNLAHSKLFGAIPPPDYSVFNDSQLKERGFEGHLTRAKIGEIVQFPDFYYNVHDLFPELLDVPVWIRMVIFPLYDNNEKPQRFVLIHENITERKQAEEALRESEETYRNLLELAPDAFFQGDEKGNIIMANKKAILLTGYTKDELLSLNIKDLFSSSVINQKPLRYDLLDKGETVSIEREVTRKDSSIVIAEMTSRKMPNSTYQSFMRDITERTMAEEALRESEEKFRTIFNESPIGIELYNADGMQINSNLASLAMFGIPNVSELHNFNLYDGTSLDDEKKEKLRRGESITYQTVFDFDKVAQYQQYTTHKTGKAYFDYIITPLLNREKRDVKGYLLQVQDITKRKLSEIELLKAKDVIQESEERFRLMIKNSNDSFVLINDNGEQFYISDAAVRDTGFTIEELKGPIQNVIFPDDLDDVLRAWNDILTKKEEIVRVQYRHKHKSRDYIWYEAVAQNFLDNPSIKAVVVNVRDITSIKETEIELRKAKEKAEESDRLKSAFLANMSHEIRTPMNGILGFADLLKKPQLTGEQQQNYIRIIETSGVRMLNIINDIIDISKIESGETKVNLSDANINEQIEHILNFFIPEAEQKGLLLLNKSKLPSVEATIRTDREKLFAILTNLVKNAIKFTDKGSIEIGYTKKGEFLEFYVKDTGIGIPKNRYQAVFERFVQADVSDSRAFQGAGLGLAITKAFVDMLGGQIWFESEEQKGSIFYFTIPNKFARKEEILNEVFLDNKTISIPKRLKVLVAEDDEPSDIYITLLLESYPCDILHARTGTETVEICRKNPDLDLILMDIKMPEMNGYEATQRIRQFNSRVIIIAVTAYALAGDKEKAIEVGCNHYLPKPLNQSVFRELIKKYFEK